MPYWTKHKPTSKHGRKTPQFSFSTHPLFQFLDDLLAALEGLSLGLIQPDLHVLDLALQTLAQLLHLQGVLLLLAQLVSKTGGVSHRLLRPLLRPAQLAVHLVKVSLQAEDGGQF